MVAPAEPGKGEGGETAVTLENSAPIRAWLSCAPASSGARSRTADARIQLSRPALCYDRHGGLVQGPMRRKPEGERKMGDTLDLKIAELLAARLCHELVSPIGAVANGLEILEDEPNFAADAGALIALSARQASRRLQFYRIAYGATTPPEEALTRKSLAEFFAEGKVDFVWRLTALPPAWAKLACNLVLLATEALPRGGKVALEPVSGGVLAVTAQGDGAKLGEPVLTLLGGPVRHELLTPRTIQAGFTALLAARDGMTIAVQPRSANELALIVEA
jgi:histidine phosphotransferase ChpT